MKNLSIKLKLILLFIIIKVIPVVLISFLALKGIDKLNGFFIQNTQQMHVLNKTILHDTIDDAINSSIVALDEKSQKSIEQLSISLAAHVANFLRHRDTDILFLSTLHIDQKVLEDFYSIKQRKVQIDPQYSYDDQAQKWILVNKKKESTKIKANNKDNEKNFNQHKVNRYLTKTMPIYKEISFFDTKGQELYKVSQINTQTLDISKRSNTYINSENYYGQIQTLEKGQIYVSDVIGAYQKSNLIGTFNQKNATKMKIDFKPQDHGYAGLENPKGKRFEAIIRFITPVFKNNQKIGYISLALDHYHIMEFTDRFHPINDDLRQDISNAGDGNYAFMWDYEARNISHPRDYFIVGFDPETGKRVPGWLSLDLAKKYNAGLGMTLNEFLQTVPKFDNQSLQKKPNIAQLKNAGDIALDCRYLNFAPQCDGWMQLTKDGGSGSFIIYWSNLWKLTTAATIPYYTGQYGENKRGFGFVTIGANVDEFHSSAIQSSQKIQSSLKIQTQKLQDIEISNIVKLKDYISVLVQELTIYTVLMIVLVVFIAIWMSNYLTNKLTQLTIAAKKFSEEDLDYRLNISSQDEIGELEMALNDMAEKIKHNKVKIKNQDRMMYQQSKMASMGEMLENIAHQWRQPLSVISTESSGVKLKNELGLLDEKDLIDTMDNITQTTQHLSKTIDDFRDFFKPQKESKVFSVESVFIKTFAIIEKKFINNDFTIIKNISDLKVDGFESELVQVFMNILTNTIDATLLNKREDRYVFIDVKEIDNRACITIQDSAGGIGKNALEKVFDPYFTTKYKENGTGIGLYMSREIIVKHMHGDISVRNNTFNHEGKQLTGAVFTITLDLID
ncbi:MAG: HAMP domain-containing sensor histidine kinase [Campylobacterota bacterium]|nr:HAMP domain-containing sensor histidine kinase [Campylobacterota bacterium]